MYVQRSATTLMGPIERSRPPPTPNHKYGGVKPMDGVVEGDAAPFTFTSSVRGRCAKLRPVSKST